MSFKPVNLIQIDPVTIPVTGEGIVSPGYLTPPQIIKAYGIPSSTGLGVKIGIVSLGGGFLQSDLDKAFADFRDSGLVPPTTLAPTIKQVVLAGATGIFDTSNASMENTVDIYCIAAIVPAADITIYIATLDFVGLPNAINRALNDGCHIISISWGSVEFISYESLFDMVTAANIAVCVFSGDWGSTFSGWPNLQVLYPSSSPNVISVGGTNLILGDGDTRATESDDNGDPFFGSQWGGGGGISQWFSLPPWQAGLSYIPITDGVTGSPTPLNARGLPDISAPMNLYSYYFNGLVSGAGGTSLSAPMIAGILARYQQLTGVQRSSVEYNKIFYANPDAFYDITVGTNNTAITSGYAGTTGWDPVTGLGPPVGTTLYKALRPNLTFPKYNHSFRPTTGAVYPRRTVGAR